MPGEVVLEARRVTKRYGRIHALTDVSLTLHRHEVVALVGDNGAGKSTFVNILAGATPATSGEILVDGKEVRFASASDSRRHGIETVYQDLALAPHLPVWANFFLGRTLTRKGILGRLGWLDRSAMIEQAKRDLAETKIRIPSVLARCETLSGGQRQAIAVARAVTWGQRVLLLDEPTAALGIEEQHRVAELVDHARDAGLPVLLVSHNLPQVQDLADRIVVLLRGRAVATLSGRDTSVANMVRWITGAGAREG
jgi:ABC-type sugar transport system ATPase subunit